MDYDPERQPSKLLEGIEPSSQKSWHSGGTAHILPEERRNASFDHDTMTTILDGSKKVTTKRRWIYGSHDDTLEDDVPLSDARKYDIERGGKDGSIGASLSNFIKLHEKHFERGYQPENYEMQLMQNASIMGGYPGYGLFISTVIGQSSGEQLGWWLWRTLTCQITGCYAQTELGHGSNVRGLETTATFHAQSKTFVLDTPTLTSMKFWPSSMVSATHAVVYAQLYIDGKHYGIHVFMVQLRDEHLRPLPGIEVGDVGTKLGESMVDIGYLRMQNVHVPLECMMAKRQHVTEDGEYVRHGKPSPEGKKNKAAYLTMMMARTTMIGGAAGALSKAATIAIRYAAVRKQGFKDASEKEEVSILDYKFTQYRLIKQLSFAVANKLACNYFLSQIGNFSQGGLLGDDDEDTTPDPNQIDISELHATSAGMKGLCCERAALGIEDCRKACGGAAYLMSSGIAALEVDYKWRATAEGDTVVMLLETAKYLVKKVGEARQGQRPTGLAACLSVLADGSFDLNSVIPQKPSTVEGWTDLGFLEKLFEARTINAIASAEHVYSHKVTSGQDAKQAFADCTLQMMRAGECHVLYFMLKCFKAVVETVDDSASRKVLASLAACFGLTEVLDGAMWAGLLDGQDEANAQLAAGVVVGALRSDAVAIVDCFEYTDIILNSTIGREDGNVYEAQYKAAVESPLNRRVVPEWFERIKEHLDLEYLAERNGEEGAANCRPELNETPSKL